MSMAPRNGAFEELSSLLLRVTGEELLQLAPVISAAIPEMRAMVGFDQHSPHHAYDLYTHTALVTGAVPRKLPLRWAALLHDVGKIDCFTLDANGRGHFYGHAKAGAEKADAILRRLQAPNTLREQVVTLIENHMTKLEKDETLLGRRIESLGREDLEDLLLLQEADMRSKGTSEHEDTDQFRRLRELIDAVCRKNGNSRHPFGTDK